MNINPFIERHRLLPGRMLGSERTSRARRRSTRIPFALLWEVPATGFVEHPRGDTAALVASTSLVHKSLALADSFAAFALAEEISFSCFSCFFTRLLAQRVTVASFCPPLPYLGLSYRQLSESPDT
jgi:hypothetical protein